MNGGLLVLPALLKEDDEKAGDFIGIRKVPTKFFVVFCGYVTFQLSGTLVKNQGHQVHGVI